MLNQPLDSTIIPVIEERVRVDIQQEIIGKVSISKNVTTETVLIQEPYTQENVTVERVAVNEYVDVAPPAIRYEGDITIVSVLQEVLVKKILVIEELHIAKRSDRSSQDKEVILRKESIDVNRA